MDPDEEEQEKEGKLDFSQDSGTFSRNPRGPAPPPAPPSSPSTSQCREPEPPDGDGDGDERRLRRLRRRLRELRERLRERKEQGGGSLGTARGPREELQEQIRECRDLLSLFRLTGISGRLSQHGFSFSLHTAFEGRLLDRFELELRQFGEPREPRVGRHCIPPFVPLQRLSRQCLPRRPRRFLELLLLHLRAFTARRQQLRAAREEFPECIVAVESQNSLFNLLSFRYRIPGDASEPIPEFRARLLYGDPVRCLPSDVSVCSSAGAALPEHSRLFLSFSLARALREMKSSAPVPPREDKIPTGKSRD